jgi:hypothetical protein
MVILFGIALLTNIDWSRNRLEAMMSASIHRRLHLGRLSWIFGINGLAIEAHDFILYEPDGAPFLNAGKTEIGIALRPLFSGQFKMRHLVLNEPELWAVRIRPGVWNFNDLLQTAFNLNFLRAEHGKIHLIDRSTLNANKTFAAMDLEDFSTKLVRPRRLANRPFLLACKIPQAGYTTTIRLSGTQLCKTNNCWTDKCKLKIHGENVDPALLTSLATIFDIDMKDTLAWIESKQLHGVFNLDGSADGVFNQRFKSELNLKAKNLSFISSDLGRVSVPNVETSIKLRARDHTLSWTNVIFKMPDSNIEGRSEGKISQWPAIKGSELSGKIIASTDDLSRLASIFPQAASLHSTKLKCILQAKGRALVESQFAGNGNGISLATKLKINRVSARGLEQVIQEEKLPMVSLIGISDTAQMSGEISVDPTNAIEYKDCLVENAGSVYKFSGYSKPSERNGRIDFAVKDYNLKQTGDVISKSANTKDYLMSFVKFSPQSKLVLSGKANINGSLEQKEQNVFVKGDISLKDARIALSSPKFSFEHLFGTIRTEPDRFVLNKLAGLVDGGKLEISGNLAKKSTGTMDLHLRASNFDLVYLNSLAHLFQIECPLFSDNRLSGPVKELSLDLSGSPRKPIVQFVVVPKDLRYQHPGLADTLRATSGTITYRNDKLDLKDVGIALKGGPIVTSLSIANLAGKARLEKIKIKTAGTDLKDAHYYLSSSLAPSVLKELYLNFVNSYKLSNTHGKVYGDIACAMSNGKPQIDGLLGFINAGGKIGDAKQPVEHVSGVLVASGQQLLLQGLSGSIRNSQFELDARINNYQELDPYWSGELRANINPQELSQWITLLGSGELMKGQFRLTAVAPLSLKAKLTGHCQSCVGSFNLACDPEDRMTVTGPFGVIHQPYGERLVCSGRVKIEPRIIQVSDGHLTLGNSSFNGEGSISKPFVNEPGATRHSTSESEVSFSIRSPETVSLKSVIGLLDPTLASEDVTGSIRGFVSLKGKISEPSVSSELFFDHVCFPQLNLQNCSGTLATAGQQESASAADGINGRLKLHSCFLGKLSVSNLTTQVKWIPATNNLKAPKIVFSDCKATIADGRFSGEGWMDLDEHKGFLQANLRGARAGKLIEQSTDLKDEITGLLDADASIYTSGEDTDQLFANMDGSGKITVSKGTVARFGPLKTRINQGNLVHQGLFGFNFNNVLQSVAPARTGGFRKLETSFRLADEHLSVEKLSFDGDDFQLWASGHANMRLHTLELQIEGKIPRVSSGVIGGPFGGLSREFTVQKVMDSITLHKLEGLPSLPVLGDIASAKPNAFTFKVLAPYDQPKLVSQSIEKSFRWLQHKPVQMTHSASIPEQYDQL